MEGHTACVFGSSLVIFGGNNDVNSSHEGRYCNKVRLVHDVSLLINRNYNWYQLQLMPAAPSPRGRAHHTAFIYNEKYMVVVGGMMEAPDEQPNSMRFVDILDLGIQRWYQAISKGDQPISRIHYASAVVNGELYIHGGYLLCVDIHGVPKDLSYHQLLSMGNLLFDTFVLNLESMIWRRVTSTDVARPLLWGHSGVVFRDNILLFGGLDTSKGKEVGDLVLWDVRKKSWRWVDCISCLPSAMHKAVVIGMHDNNNMEPTRMLVFGGIQFLTQETILELREFDFENGQWNILPSKGDIPAGRIGHVLLSYMSDKVLLLGGVIGSPNGPVQDSNLYIYDVPTQEWIKIFLYEGEKLSTKGETHIHPKPFTTDSYTRFEEKLNELQVDQSNKNRCFESIMAGRSTHLFEERLANFRKSKEMMYQSFPDEKEKDSHQGALGSRELEFDLYDAPPPLPSAAYVISTDRNQGFGEVAEIQKKIDEKLTGHMNYDRNNKWDFNDVENASNISEEQHFGGPFKLMNISFFEGEKSTSLEESGKIFATNTLSYLSSPFLKKLMNSVLRQEASEGLPDHINNGQSLKDPFSYLRPTESVLRWRHASPAP
ncbi:putative Kelch repeat protein [Trypanosoma rangeli]|uniref:Putative Kelch repeat protein n=1 Tax=Trypanosoma rangeli TaxID=5698 RepID=A0A422NS97_TRYRA|nr:putative Kelch repeat protein [Trypanosoma rangeli]RNF08333.1 putative Kelch repeat protein [Trypanosoma rangeli]|eukprot:RNF08333.1 putative Kelch repeat protein [Trypanosoma rangeli]